MTRLNRTSARRRNPRAWAPSDHNAAVAQRKAFWRATRRMIEAIREAKRAFRRLAHGFTTNLTIARRVERGTPEHAALTAQMRERFAKPGTSGSFESRLPDEPNPPLTAEVIRTAADRMRANGDRVRQQPLGTIWAPEPLGRKSDYVLASGGSA